MTAERDARFCEATEFVADDRSIISFSKERSSRRHGNFGQSSTRGCGGQASMRCVLDGASSMPFILKRSVLILSSSLTVLRRRLFSSTTNLHLDSTPLHQLNLKSLCCLLSSRSLCPKVKGRLTFSFCIGDT